MKSIADITKDLKIIYHLIKPAQGSNQKERLENFYSGQAADYDDFRKRLLKGREQLFRSVSQAQAGIWLDLGGGTGANLESVPNLADFTKVYIVDLSPSLLEIARQRIAKHQWHNVEIIEDYATSFVPPEGLVDIITFSYSLTMIENWFVAIDRAKELLKPGGIIGVVDFYVSRKNPPPEFDHHGWLVRTFWQTWFAIDNVFLSPEHLAYLNYNFDQIELLEDMAFLPFPPLVKAPYYLFIGRKKISEEGG
jgi:S-adenosylmethionine-diacylgycerolhomoserine-N-methlytransferase